MRVAVDTGGTFTDCVFVRNGCIEILKLPASPSDAPDTIGKVIREILATTPHSEEHVELICGTTAGTNALIERRGARVALVTTAGFEDVIEIGRQARPKLYELCPAKPEPLVPRAFRFGMRERMDATGKVVAELTESEIRAVAKKIQQMRPDSVAICFLFSFVNARHEKMATQILRKVSFSVSASHEILPQFREYERTSTTVVNAYLAPIMRQYVGSVTREAARCAPHKSTGVHVMQSNGGIISAATAAREPVRTVLSGPAGGVLGARASAARAGFDRVISLDMGGTSTDVSLVDGELQTTTESSVAGLPVAIPMLEIHTVGAGGGSIARFDAGGALRVGPESAGAEPGPIAYGRGEQPTVTDAHVVLGRLGQEGLLGGDFKLNIPRVRKFMHRAVQHLRRSISIEKSARGILDITAMHVEKAIRVISTERGHDTRDFTLVAFGGAGGLQACELAESLEIPRVMIPKFPGALSALGIFNADVVKDYTQTVMLRVDSVQTVLPKLRLAFTRLERTGTREMKNEGFAPTEMRFQRTLEMRYHGQSYELQVPLHRDFITAFHNAHEKRYGSADRSRAVEIVNVRLKLSASFGTHHPRARKAIRYQAPKSALIATRKVWFIDKPVSTFIYERGRLRPGAIFRGPAIITEYSATTVVPPRWTGRVDGFENLILEPSR